MVSFAGTLTADSGPSAPSNLSGSVSPGDTAATRTRITHTSIYITGTAYANVTIKVEISTDSGVTWTEQTEARTTADSDGNWTTTVALTGGMITGIRVYAEDAVGEESSTTLFGYVLVDTNSPVVTITSPADGTTTNQASITVTGTVIKDAWESWDDLTLTVQVGTDSVTVPIYAASFTYSVALAEGVNTILVSVTDDVNVSSTASITVTRTTAPSTTTPTPGADHALILGISVMVVVVVTLVTVYVAFTRYSRGSLT